MWRRTIPSSPSRPGQYYEDPRYFNPRLAKFSSKIDLSYDSARQLISELNTQFTQRSFEFRNHSQQLELLRLETVRRNILLNMDLPSDPFEAKSAQDSSGRVILGLSPIGEPGPSVPTTLRTRAAVLSESEISVLDIGPSLHSSHNSTIASRRSSTSKRNKPGLVRTSSPSFVAGPDSDGSDKASPAQTPLRTADLDSVAITSASGSVTNEFPLRLRQRRRDQPNLTLPGPRGLQLPRYHRSFSGSHYEHLGYGYGFSGFSTTNFHTTDEHDRRIHSLSVPHSPRSPSGPRRPSLPRSQSSFGGIDPEFAAMRNAEQVRTTMAARMATSEQLDHNDGEGEL